MFSIQQLADITGSEISGPANAVFSHFLTDSRNLHGAQGTLFVALSTPLNNGHKYIEQLIKQGVKTFLIKSEAFPVTQYPQVSFVISRDPLQALQKFAAWHRSQFNIPVIGITGSNGKTVVKEWLYQLLKSEHTICRNPKSYNSQLGVPLSVMQLNADHTLGIFEAGISQPGEMENLEKMIQPSIGVFTSIGSAHDEGFSGRQQKISEKFLLFKNCDKIVVNGLDESEIPEEYLDRCIAAPPVSEIKAYVKLYDEASLSNISTCVGVLRVMGINDEVIFSRISELQHIALRLEIKNGVQNSLLINDYYNSDLDSLRIAINYLQQQHRRQKKVLILSDIEQSGMQSIALYRQLAELVNSAGVDVLVGVGSEIGKHRSYFKANSLFFDDTQKFLSNLRSFDFQLANSTILLKGARSFGFESVSRVLQQKSHDTVFEINLNRLVDNVNYYRTLVGSKVKIMCMVKAMGYGSGSTDIARTLQHMGVNYLAVAYADEGVELRQSNISLPVMVMNPEEEALEDIINFNLEPEIYSFKVLQAFAEKLDSLAITEPYPVHIKIDTGMKRLGFEPKDVQLLCEKLSAFKNIKVLSVFSHLAGSDNPALDNFTNDQISRFEVAASAIEKTVGTSVIKHICNSGGITRFPQAHYDMVRLGIGMYGIGVTEAEQKKLKNVGVLKSRISQIKKVLRDESVGYNRNGKVSRDTLIAVVPIGYADGFSRLLGNGKHGVYIHGKFCRTVGNICMDMHMVDVTDLKCEEGDEVVIFESAEQISDLAKALGSIPYEVLTNVSGRVKRVYVQE
jgi:alanine racemase